MSYLLDTSIVSELVRQKPNPGVMDWFENQEEDDLFISVLTLGELEKGIAKLPETKRKASLRKWIRDDLTRRFEGRVLAVDERAATCWGALCGAAELGGRPLPVIDSLIAACAQVSGLVVVTRNVADFARCNVQILDPWRE